MQKRKLNNVYINIGMWACLLSALINIASCILSFTTSTIDGFNIFKYCWNAVFFLIVGNYFYRSKNSYYGRIMNAVLILAICTYIIPAITDLIKALIEGGIQAFLSYTLLILFSSMMIGIVYSIALILYSRKASKGRYIFLLVMGSILLGVQIIEFAAVDLPFFIESITTAFSNVSTYGVTLIVIDILFGVQFLVNLLFAYVYFYTPLFFKNK